MKNSRFLLVGIVVLLALIVLATSFITIPSGSVGVITRFGAVNRVANAGISMKMPLVEAVTKMNVRTQKDEITVSAASYNLQTVNSVIAVNYHLDPPFAAEVFATVGRDYQELVIAPAIQDAFKAVTARYTAEQLIQKREEVSADAKEELQSQVERYHIIVENFNIINFDFTADYNAAIEAKQVAEQEVATARQRLQKAQVEAEILLTQAEGQANAQKAIEQSGALTEEYLRYLFLNTWDGKLPQVMGSGDIMSVMDVMNFAQPEQP